jgi:serine/threonine-protein kinase
MTAPIAAPTSPLSPSTLAGGRYVLGEVLGRGGVAVTRKAIDRKLDRDVAVKSLSPSGDPELAAAARSRFLREARALARFDHPGIVRVYEAFEEDGWAHLVMEFLAGRSVGAELTARGRPLEIAEAETVAAGAGRALAVVHAARMLHRDVSPSNVVLVGGRPVLVDFGLARDLATSGVTADVLTRMVTPGFSPPEQYDGDAARVGPPTDVYGLAATLYHALAGRLPATAVQRTAGTRLEPLRRLRPDVPRPLADGIHDGLELDPGHRPATMAAFLARMGLPADVLPLGVRPTTPAHPIPVRQRAPAPPLPVVVEGHTDGIRRPDPPVRKPARRWPALVPVLAVAAALGWVMPLPGVALLALVGVPAVATMGDRLGGVARMQLPWRFAHHAVATVRSATTAVAVAGGGVLLGVLLDRLAPASAADAVVAGTLGAVAAVAVAGPATTGALADGWVARCRGRLLAGSWVAAVLATLGALALEPDLLPFSG